MRSDPEALERCDQHGLMYDPRLTRGCVLCRRPLDEAGAPDSRGSYAISLMALIAAGSVFGWIYVKPLVLPHDGSRVSMPPSTISDGDTRLQPSATGESGAQARRETDPNAGEAALHPFSEPLWSEVAREFQAYEGSEPALRELRDAYGIQVHVPPAAQLNLDRGSLTGARPTPLEVADAARSLLGTLAVYPRAFVSRMGFSQLVLIDGLHHKGTWVGAFAMGPAFTLVADPNALVRNGAHQVHHELFHLVDYRLHGNPARHDAWIALNAPSTRYLGARAVMQTGDFARLSQLRHDLPGFVTQYAQSDAAEDMAETFALLMTQRAALKVLTNTDPVIAAKVKYVTETLDHIASGTSIALGL